MIFRRLSLIPTALALALLAGCASSPSARSTSASTARRTSPPSATATAAASAQLAAASEQVANTERAFARTLAERNLKGFLSFLSPDAIFFSGNNVEHGPAEIANEWAPFFNAPQAPFSWRPDHVEVTADGRLALSTGPILQEGVVVGRFNSIWRLEGTNTWRIIFDKGERVCGPAPAG